MYTVAMRAELIRASELLRSSDPSAVEEAIRLLQGTVYSFSMKVCGHREDAEDTMQDVLLKSIPYLPKLNNPQVLAVWLYKVARNRCWMSRRRSKFAPTETLSLDDLLPDASELESLTAKTEGEPEAAVLATENAERVRDAILRIPPQYRLILVLHDMEDLDTSEVARITGLREGTVRVRLHRARLFVRRELSQQGTSSPQTSRRRSRRAPRPLQCREMFAQLSDYIDGRIDEVHCEQIEKHLQDCPPCLAFVHDLEQAVERCRKYEISCAPETAEKVRSLLAAEYSRILRQAAHNTASK